MDQNDKEQIETLRKNWIEIKENVNRKAAECGREPSEITVVAVSKTHPVEMIINGMEAGIDVFGENYAQELRDKHKYLLENDLKQPRWHYIGHLQTNKVKYLAPFVEMIHSVDSVKLAEAVSKQAERFGREIAILLQVNTSGEESKSGCRPEEIIAIAKEVIEIPHLNVQGLMTIGSFSPDESIVRGEFKMLSRLLGEVNRELGLNLKHLSMGMSGDYLLAVEEGATFVRVGTNIFGERDYSK